MATIPARYAGKPLVRLLECYILWAISELGENEEAMLAAMTPKLQRLFESSGPWQEIVASTVEASTELPERLRELWQRNLAIAHENNVELTPQQFAEMVIDENFV